MADPLNLVGTLIHAYILYLVFCEKGKMVLSPEYQTILGADAAHQIPHIAHRVDRAWCLFGDIGGRDRTAVLLETVRGIDRCLQTFFRRFLHTR